ncbi:uncharacterized protein MELLADRAFT_101818 [Melampsora larici-populina 98AG31]|uniref:2'-phosphotransferase n=1 Tax=Melampsora larici-populina (strain 98AG31 / pathotype 3-4-7) TaxID=747676 RepID=F4R507_MELLP|nr:uncharacterized protein MELLADRAFT_101818 [Melampsora larici-populina 98AG31]EGG11975.1 hypothetical protein MELLADRAFT_101818 [Melampsora larici-populina 98AG31]
MRGRMNDSPDTQLSKTLSYLLRHGAAKEGLKMRSDGFVKINDLLARPKLKGVELGDIERIVGKDSKQRYAMIREPPPDGSSSSEDIVYIRANQGHSIQVPELDLVPIIDPEDIPTVVHGTYMKFWDTILLEGLKPMKRTHIHFASGLIDQPGVISGMRASREIDIYLDVTKCISAGILFHRSKNGVILSQGLPDSNSIPSTYFQKVIHTSGKVLYPTESST